MIGRLLWFPLLLARECFAPEEPRITSIKVGGVELLDVYPPGQWADLESSVVEHRRAQARIGPFMPPRSQAKRRRLARRAGRRL